MPNKHSSCVITNINTYLRAHKKHTQNNPLYLKYNKMSVEELISAYKQAEKNSGLKDFLLELLYLKIFFYFPSFLSKKRYKLSMPLYDDALQNISSHILEAIKRFDPSKGTSFLAYAYGDLTAAMAQTFKETNVVRLPPGAYCNECELAPSTENNDISPDTILVSKSTLFSDISYSDTVDYDEDLHSKQLVEWLEEALTAEADVLTDDERLVVILHNGLFGNEPMVYADIAALRKEMGKGCSRSRISQIHTKAIGKLKKWFADIGLAL